MGIKHHEVNCPTHFRLMEQSNIFITWPNICKVLNFAKTAWLILYHINCKRTQGILKSLFRPLRPLQRCRDYSCSEEREQGLGFFLNTRLIQERQQRCRSGRGMLCSSRVPTKGWSSSAKCLFSPSLFWKVEMKNELSPAALLEGRRKEEFLEINGDRGLL